jgi:hypothetical protein
MPTEPLITAQPKDFRAHFNARPFAFKHRLGNHPLFELKRLATVADALLAAGKTDHFVHRSGEGTVSSGLDRPFKERVADAVANVERPGSWIKLTQVHEVDAEHKEVLDGILSELEEQTALPLRADISWVTATLFIASPGTMTPYHIDHEPNFLFQISGQKEVNLFDPADRSILTDEEIERYYVGELNATRYREEVQPKAYVFKMQPGDAVHHPTLAPHWVKNGPTPTIALSVAFGMRSVDPRARVYQVNHYLRKLGLKPTPIGQSGWRDAAKIAALGLFSTKNPKTDQETIGSGLRRIKAPVRAVKRIVGRFSSR